MIICNYCNHPLVSAKDRCLQCGEYNPALKLSLDEVTILADYLKNDYLTHDEPARSILLKIHQFANSK